VAAQLKDVVEDFKELLPLVAELGNPALQLRHWADIFAIIGAQVPRNDQGTGAWLCTTWCVRVHAEWTARQLTQDDVSAPQHVLCVCCPAARPPPHRLCAVQRAGPAAVQPAGGAAPAAGRRRGRQQGGRA
jgi:hypothetical protein